MNDYLKTLMLATSLALPLATPALAQPAAGPHGTTGSLGGTTSIRGLSPNNGQTGQGGATSGQTGTMSGQNGAATGLTTGTASTTGGTTSGMSANNGQAGAVPGQGSAISATNEDTIRSMLKSQGYADIDGLRHDGSKYTIMSAERYGKKVHNIDVDAQTGLVRNPEKLSESQVKDLLKQRGYSDVSDVRKDGDHFSANAKQAGQDVKLKIDAEQGTVTPQNS